MANRKYRQYYYEADKLLMKEPERYFTVSEIVKILETIFSGGKQDIPPFATFQQYLSRKRNLLELHNQKNLEGGFRYKENGVRFLGVENKPNVDDKDAEKLFRTNGLELIFKLEPAKDPLIMLEDSIPLKGHLVKSIYGFLNRSVISFTYLQGYKKKVNITLHPHILKEYNGRWYLFGYVKDQESGKLRVKNFALDRIIEQKNDTTKKDETFKVINNRIEKPRFDYKDYFKEFVGVTRERSIPLQKIVFRTTNELVDQLIDTKPIHPSQRQFKHYPFCNEEHDPDKRWGKFTIEVIPNMELKTKLLAFGDGVYVSGESEFAKEFRQIVKSMAEMYRVCEPLSDAEKQTPF